MSLVIAGRQTLVAAAWDVAGIGSAVFGGYAQEYQALSLRTRAVIDWVFRFGLSALVV